MRSLKNHPAGFGIISLLLAVTPLQAQIYNWTTIAGNAGWGSADGTNSDARFSAPVGMAADHNGNLFVTDYRADTIRKLTPAGTNWVVSTLAGQPGSAGSSDGTNSAARFKSPVGITVDPQGRIFVGDCYNYAIRMLTPTGTNWVVTTAAGKAGTFGSVNGTNSGAHFGFVYGVVADANGNVYVADGNYQIRKLTPVGTNWVVTTIVGNGSYGSADGTNNAARFGVPTGLTIDPEGNLYESDRSQTIRRIVPAGTNWVVTTLAGSPGNGGSTDGTNSTARFFYPGGLSADGQGHVLVADSNNHTLRCLTQQGTNWIVTTIAGLAGQFGDVDGSNSTARFYYPHDIAVGTNGIFYVTDDDNYCIRSLTPVGTTWIVGTIAGSGGPGITDGTNNLARFNSPQGMALNINGTAFVVDQKNNIVRQLTLAGTNWVVSTIAGKAGIAGSADGTNSDAQFSAPGALAIDVGGNLYLTDTGNDTIRKLIPLGTNWVASTIAGQAGIPGSADGTNSGAHFASPYGLAVDTVGNLYVADTGNATLRKLSPAGTNWVVTTIAGLAGNYGYLDGTNSGAHFYEPLGLAVNPAGAIFVADYFNNCIREVALVGTNWVVTTIAGSHTSAGGADGTNGTALFWNPTGVTVNSAGVLFIADSQNNSIRKVAPMGTNWVVTTIGGLDTIIGVQPFVGNSDGTNSQALFNGPAGIVVDANVNLLVADSSNNTIREGIPMLPTIQALSANTAAITFSWFTVPGQTYQVQSKMDLLQTSWNNLGSPVIATNSSATTTDAITNSQRFYRIEQLP
jgi:streptogramin lyase